jgi:hypothetical protein
VVAQALDYVAALGHIPINRIPKRREF